MIVIPAPGDDRDSTVSKSTETLNNSDITHRSYNPPRLGQLKESESLIRIKHDIEEEDFVPLCCSARLAVALLGFIGFFVVASQQVTVPLALECMVNISAVTIPLWRRQEIDFYTLNVTEADELQKKKNFYHPECELRLSPFVLWNGSSLDHVENAEFDWTKSQQNIVQWAYYWGMFLSLFPSGYLCVKFGGKHIFGIFVFFASLATVAIPFGARIHYFILMMLRFVQGLGMGSSFPSMHAIWSKWAPPEERGRLVTISISGIMMGHCCAIPFIRYVCGAGFLGGWPAVFYFYGILGFIWVIIWMFLVSNSPMTYRRIRWQEKAYIIRSLDGQAEYIEKKREDIPIFTILINMPFLALVMACFTYQWGYVIFMKYMPVYLMEVLKMDMRANPYFRMLPHIGLFIVIICGGILADKLMATQCASPRVIRTLYECIGKLIPACFLVVLGFLHCSQWMAAVIIMSIAFALTGFQYSGFVLIPLDIAPKYAAFIFGTAQGIGMLSGFMASFVLKNITSTHTVENWKSVFYITVAFYFFGCLCFMVCGTATLVGYGAVEPNYHIRPGRSLLTLESRESLHNFQPEVRIYRDRSPQRQYSVHSHSTNTLAPSSMTPNMNDHRKTTPKLYRSRPPPDGNEIVLKQDDFKASGLNLRELPPPISDSSQGGQEELENIFNAKALEKQIVPPPSDHPTSKNHSTPTLPPKPPFIHESQTLPNQTKTLAERMHEDVKTKMKVSYRRNTLKNSPMFFPSTSESEV